MCHSEYPYSYVGVGYALCLLCALLTPTANPFYYTIFNSSFKAAVYDMCPCFYKEQVLLDGWSLLASCRKAFQIMTYGYVDARALILSQVT